MLVAAVAAGLALAAPHASTPALMTTRNAAEPVVAGERVFWAEEHGRHARVRMAAPGHRAKTIFRLTGPHARSAPSYARVIAIGASRHLVAFTVSAGYGDPFTCGAIEERPAGDARCKAGRETVSALYAGPIGGPYRRLAGVSGRRTSRCFPATEAGAFDVSGAAIAYSEERVRCSGGFSFHSIRVVARGDAGGGRPRALAGCPVHRTTSPYNDSIALARDYLAWSPEACDRHQRVRLFRWRSGELVYRLPDRWFLDPFDVARDGTVIGQALVHAHGEDAYGYLVSFQPRHHPKARILRRFGVDADALRIGGRRLAVEYSPSNSSPTDTLVTSDREGRHRRVVASGLEPAFPWIDFDGSVVAWTAGDPPVRVYAQRIGR